MYGPRVFRGFHCGCSGCESIRPGLGESPFIENRSSHLFWCSLSWRAVLYANGLYISKRLLLQACCGFLICARKCPPTDQTGGIIRRAT